MDAGEICRSYAAAKNKNDQILILADLNDCSTQEILDVLTEGGMISGVSKAKKQKPIAEPKAKRAAPLKWTPEMDKELIRLGEEDLAVLEIADRMGLESDQVKRRKHKLTTQGYIFKRPKQQPKAKQPELPPPRCGREEMRWCESFGCAA